MKTNAGRNPEHDQPGLPEIVVGLLAYLVLLVPLALLSALLPQDQPVLLGDVGSTVGGYSVASALSTTLLH